MPSAPPSLDKTIRAAIAGRRMVSFDLDGLPRVGEPHDYGILNGERQLFFYQVGGKSKSGTLPDWRNAWLSKVSGMKILDEQFAGPRPAPSGRHKKWDKLIASVSRPELNDGN